MDFLWKKEIDDIKNSGYLNKQNSITDALIENFFHEILKPEELELLRLVFEPNPTQEALDDLLTKWDIEVKAAHKSLLLAYFMNMHPELKFREYEGPRLKGLLTFFKFNNLKIISHYSKIAKALNNAGIIPVILKGGAMKYLRPNLPRVMGDIDALVKFEEFDKSIQIICSLGYTYNTIYQHSVDFHIEESEYGILDLHRFIHMDTGYEKKLLNGLYKRAIIQKVFQADTYVPSNEDMLFISLVNLARNLRDKTSQAGLLYTLFDCKYLLDSKKDFDWEIVKQNAKLTKTEVQMNFAIKFINKISTNIFPKEIRENTLFEKETNDYSNMVMYNRFYLETLRKKCKPIKILDAINSMHILKDYLKYKPKYALLKSLRKHPRLIEWFIKDLRKDF